MITFLIAISFLIIGYIVYGHFMEKVLMPDDTITPALKINDGVDFMPLPLWKLFLIQLLNIAGTGPIFGALAGALFGPIVYLWIVFGCIFAGAVHDYSTGMISMRNNGKSIPEIAGIYLGNKIQALMRVFSVILLVMCGVVFTTGPADLLSMITPEFFNTRFWLIIITIYYFIASFVPVDKVIGKIYPLFGICLITMALGVAGSLLFSGNFEMPELWNNFCNMHPTQTPIWPFMFITVACGAISGFHATQSPMMARCCKSEKEGRFVFYGAMITEGIIALIWAAAGVTIYENTQALLQAGGGCSAVVYQICQTTMGKTGMILALLGVIICPISSGDTAYRSARLTIADWFKIDQKVLKNRLLITLALLISGTIITQLDYTIVWRYFSWANQSLAAIALWTFCVYFKKNQKNFIPTFIPAVIMSAVTSTYFVAAPECLGILWSKLGLEFNDYYPFAIMFGIFFALYLSLYFLTKNRTKM